MAANKSAKIKTNTHRFIDHRSPRTRPIQGFTLDADDQIVLHDMVESGRNLNCNTIEHPAFWRDDWICCPLCGGPMDEDGEVLHRGNH